MRYEMEKRQLPANFEFCTSEPFKRRTSYAIIAGIKPPPLKAVRPSNPTLARDANESSNPNSLVRLL